MKMNTKVKLTEKWWVDNKAKTLKDKGNLAKALKKFELVQKFTLGARYIDFLKVTHRLIAVCETLKSASQANVRACNSTLHKETKLVLQKGFVATVDNVVSEKKKNLAKFSKKINGLTLQKILRDPNLKPIFIRYGRDAYFIESYDFLLALKKEPKGSEEIFNDFVNPNSRSAVNLPVNVVRKLGMAMENGSLQESKDEWKQVKAKAISLLSEPLSAGRFHDYMLQKAGV